MRGIANGTQVTALPTPAAAVGTPGYCNNAAPGPGVTPTDLYPDDVNIILAELLAILAAAGVTPDATGANTGQVLAAIKELTFPTSYSGITTSTALSATQAGTFFNVGGTSTTQTLPAASSVTGKSFGFYASSAFTLASAGGLILGSGIVATSVSLANGQFVCVQSDGTNWRIFSLSPDVPFTLNQSIAAGGYQKLPGNIILQWGTATLSTGNGDIVTLPIAFPNAILQVLPSSSENGCHGTGWTLNGASTSTFKGYGMNPNGTVTYLSTFITYIAIGY